MSVAKLNHKLLQKLMETSGVRALDMARDLGVSKQMGNYIIHHGGLKYAAALAKRFDCKEKDLIFVPPPVPRPTLVRLPPGMVMVNGKLRRKPKKRKRGKR